MHSDSSEDISRAQATTSGGLLVVMMNVPPEAESDFNDWYDNEHVPDLLSVPGVLSARRFVASQGQPKYLLLLEVASTSVLDSPSYAAIRNAARTESMRPYMQDLIRNIYECYQPATQTQEQ
jgi:hypothetical protein